MSFSYNPNHLVRYMHKVAHLNKDLQIVDDEFTLEDGWNSDYAKSLMTVPILISGGVVTLIFLLAMSFCFRCCCSCCKCAPKEMTNFGNSNMNTKLRWLDRMVGTRDSLSRNFILFCLFLLLADHILFIGNFFLTKGVRIGEVALDDLIGVGLGLSNNGYVLHDSVYSFLDNLGEAQTSCEYLDELEGKMDTYKGSINNYVDNVEQLPQKLMYFHDLLNEWGINKKNESVWVLYAVIFVVTAIYIVGIKCESKSMLQFAIFASHFIMLGYVVIFCLEMMLLMGLADFCMSPTANILSQLADSNFYNLAEYYSTCEGTNPIDSELSEHLSDISSFNSTLLYITAPGAACDGNTYITEMIHELQSIYTSLNSVSELAECAPINYHWNEVFNTGICDKAYTGLFVVWMSQITTLVLLMLLTLTVSILYQYFGVYWTLTRDDILATSLEENDPFRYSSHSTSSSNLNAADRIKLVPNSAKGKKKKKKISQRNLLEDPQDSLSPSLSNSDIALSTRTKRNKARDEIYNKLMDTV